MTVFQGLTARREQMTKEDSFGICVPPRSHKDKTDYGNAYPTNP